MSSSLRKQLEEMKETLEEMRVQMKYMEFDLEATRRERKYYKNLLAEKR